MEKEKEYKTEEYFKTILFEILKRSLENYGYWVVETDEIKFPNGGLYAAADVLKNCGLKKDFLKWIESNRYDLQEDNTALNIGIKKFVKEDEENTLDECDTTKDLKQKLFNYLKNLLIRYGYEERQHNPCEPFDDLSDGLFVIGALSQILYYLERRIDIINSLIYKCGWKKEFVECLLKDCDSNNDLKSAMEIFYEQLII